MKQLLSKNILLLPLFILCFVSTMTAQNNDGFIYDFKKEQYRDINTGGYMIGTQPFGSGVLGGFIITPQVFGQEMPLDGGLLIMALAGAAYSFKKRKKNNKK